MNPETGLMEPDAIRAAIKEAHRRGKKVVAIVLETPNNPWMQVYPKEVLVEIAEIAREYDLYVINDLYLFGTESPGIEQVPFVVGGR